MSTSTERNETFVPSCIVLDKSIKSNLQRVARLKHTSISHLVNLAAEEYLRRIALLVPDIPKAILMLHGEPNSAKTTLLELIKMLIDPCSTRTLTCRNESDELAQLFSHNYLSFFDNLSYI